MTAQIPESILIDGRPRSMGTEPLEGYFAQTGIRPSFEAICTALWRGYVGHWEIAHGRLHLLRIDARYADGREATLADFFPEHPERVFAHWYSGTLRIPEGEMLDYVHGGYGSTFERDRLIHVARGVVTSTHVRTNGVAAETDDTIAEYRTFGMTISPGHGEEDAG